MDTQVRPNRSLRYNAGVIIPELFDRMAAFRTEVFSHPENTEFLHDMRIAGRPLRYIMESFQPAFGRDFRSCILEVKKFLDLAGQVHDCDVMIGLMEQAMPGRAKPSVGSLPGSDSTEEILAKLIQNETSLRNKKFTKLGQTMDEWDRKAFREKLSGALE